MADWVECEETGKPFGHCQKCKLPLLETAASWLVNKEYFRGECILEYAICQPCRDEVTDGFSEDSKESVRLFLENEIDWAERVKEFMMAHDVVERLDACIACRGLRADLDGFGISALFDSGGSLITGPLPLMICRSCVVKMTAGLSDQSRAIWRKFLDENFDGPPDDKSFSGLI